MGDRELAQEMYTAWSADGPVAAAERFFSEDFEYHDMPEVPDQTITHGREAMIGLWREREQLIGHFEIELEESHDMGEELLTVVRLRSNTGRGFEIDMRHVHLLLFRDGLLARMRAFTSREDAEAATRRGAG